MGGGDRYKIHDLYEQRRQGQNCAVPDVTMTPPHPLRSRLFYLYLLYVLHTKSLIKPKLFAERFQCL